MNSRDAEPLDAVEDTIAQCIELLEHGGPEELEGYLRSREDADQLRERLGRLTRLGLLEPDDNAGEAAMGDFVRGTRIGGGGMGVVFRGRQSSVDREVAIKVLNADLASSPTARARFQREADVLARLDHPGIVRVIGAGECEGQPFLAMELIRGATLQEVVAAVRDHGPARLAGRDLGCVIERISGRPLGEGGRELCAGTWHDAVLRMLQQTAAALAHAHEHALLHRDVKPSNIMVTPDGRVLLLDFGLSVSLDPMHARVTRTGSTPGSPAYMAPEQAHGAAPDRRTDIYGLGVTMYELLGLELPFLADTEPELRMRVESGEVVPLQHRNRTVSRDMATVCAMAMERDPARRYADARAFADDLGRLLRREPVAARSPGPLLRLRRWIRRRPATATALCAALLACGGVPTLLLVQEQAAASRLLREKQRAEAGETAAVLNLQTALQAVDRFLHRFGSEELEAQPMMTGPARAAIEDAVAFYETLRRRQLDDPRLVVDHVRALRNLAALQRERGDRAEVDEVLAEAREVAAAAPPSPEMGLERARLLRLEGAWLRDRERFDEAEARLGEALALATAAGEAPHLRRDAAMVRSRAHFQLGEIARSRGRSEAALAAHSRGVAVLEELSAADDVQVAARLARALGGRSSACLLVKGREAALPDLDRALAILDGMPASQREFPGHRALRASLLGMRADLLFGRATEEARRCDEEAAGLLETLHREFPDDRGNSVGLAVQLREMASRLEQVDRLDGAAVRLQTAIELLRSALQGDPGSTAIRCELGESLRLLALLRQRGGDATGSIEAIAEAIALVDDAVNDSLRRQDALLRLLMTRATMQSGGAAVEDLRRCRQLAEGLLQQAPERAVLSLELSTVLTNLAGECWDELSTDELAALLQESLRHKRAYLQRAPGDHWAWHTAANSEHKLGLLGQRRGEPDLAVTHLQAAMAASLRAVEGLPRHDYRERWFEVCGSLADYLGELGRWQELVDVVVAVPTPVADPEPAATAILQASAMANFVDHAGEAERSRWLVPLRAATLASLLRVEKRQLRLVDWQQFEPLARLAGDADFGPVLRRLGAKR